MCSEQADIKWLSGVVEEASTVSFASAPSIIVGVLAVNMPKTCRVFRETFLLSRSLAS